MRSTYIAMPIASIMCVLDIGTFDMGCNAFACIHCRHATAAHSIDADAPIENIGILAAASWESGFRAKSMHMHSPHSDGRLRCLDTMDPVETHRHQRSNMFA